jgi:hypothetical protein
MITHDDKKQIRRLACMLALLFPAPAKAAPPVAAPAASVVRITPLTRNDTASQAAFDLAVGGKALFPVVIAVQASPGTEAVARELAGYLTRISGATFEVVRGNGTEGIVLGTLAEIPTPHLGDALAIVNDFDGREAYAIRTEKRRLLLLGATELGASHAAFRFLEELGVRWFFPSPEWEVVPRITNLSFRRDITDRPSIPARQIWFEAGSGGEEQNAQYVAWKRHNRQAESFVVNAGHNLDSVIRVNQAAFDAHPEYLALVKQADGSMKRQGPQLELSNPAVRKMVVDYAVGYFKDNPGADMVSLDPADTASHSESPESLAMGSVSDRVFGMANEAARALQKACPGKMVGLYSYSAHWDPPSFNLEPNVHVLLAGLGQGKYTPAERDALWTQRSGNSGFYEYFSVWLWTYDRLPGSWVNDIRGAQAGMRDRVARHGKSISAESTSSWGPNGRGYYIVNRLLWNPDVDVEAAARDFYDGAFGAGAAAMKRYYERLNPGAGAFMSRHLMALAFRDVDEASRQTLGRPDIQARLDHIKLYLRYVHLDWMRNREPVSDAQRAALDTAIMTHLYRTRATALTAWEMIRQNWGQNKRPGQDRAEWMVDVPYTHGDFVPDEMEAVLTGAEQPAPRPGIETEFQEGRAYFQPAEIGEPVTFSSDLVPVAWPAAPTIASEQSYQGGARYYFYSLHGEPLEFTTRAGDAWGGINRFTLTDATGVAIAAGRLPNNVTTNHVILVPKSGLYQLDYNDNGSYWSITVAPGRVATLPMGQRQDYRNSKVMQEMYFYVPKGTRQIEYFYTRTAFHPGGRHTVLDPDGTAVKVVDVNGDWVHIPVPEGMDGKLWRLSDPVLGVFWFNNVPNCLAASPDALLVPRELATRDALPLRR